MKKEKDIFDRIMELPVLRIFNPFYKEPETQEVPHRDGMYGISDKSCHDIDATFSRDKVRNDVTGKWRVSAISADDGRIFFPFLHLYSLPVLL